VLSCDERMSVLVGHPVEASEAGICFSGEDGLMSDQQRRLFCFFPFFFSGFSGVSFPPVADFVPIGVCLFVFG